MVFVTPNQSLHGTRASSFRARHLMNKTLARARERLRSKPPVRVTPGLCTRAGQVTGLALGNGVEMPKRPCALRGSARVGAVT